MENAGLLIALLLIAVIIACIVMVRQEKKRQQQSQIQAETAQAELAQNRISHKTLVEQHATLRITNERLETVREHHQQEIIRLNDALTDLQNRQHSDTSQLNQSRETLKEVQTQLAEKQTTMQNYKSWWENTQSTLETLRTEHDLLGKQHTQLQTSLDERDQRFKEQKKLLQEGKEIQKKEFENLANEILERKSKAFKTLNQESIGNLLTPIHSEMKAFKSRVETLHSKDIEQRSQLKTELKNLQQLNKEITDQASKLTTALQGQKKVQGNWGELMLENVLDNSGLRLGTDYKREVSFATEEGRKRPDVVVYLPHQQHLVIDAKTSLIAYTNYVNADNNAEREQALAAHTSAVSDRITELADREYFKLPGLNSPEVVILFIPIESAYVEALKHDETLFQRAIERNVLVATPTTLLTSLNIVRQLWRFEDQNKHTAELANRAEKFYNKLNGFLTSMQGVGKQLDKAKESYEKAFGQLHSGRGNLIKQAAEFKELGVSVQKELPPDLVEQANLELGKPALIESELTTTDSSVPE